MAFTEEYRPVPFEQEWKRENLQPINNQYPTPLQALVVQDLNQGKSPNIGFVGDTGNGKSMKALRFVEDLYEMNVFNGEFEPSENLVYGAEAFLEVLVDQDVPDATTDDVKDDREAIIFDEAGVELNVAEYMAENNRSIDKTLQVARAWNNLYIFIAPKVKDMDSRIQQRLDYLVKVWGQGKSTTYKVIDVADKMDGKTIFKVKLANWYPDLPSDELVKKYREKEMDKKSDTINEMKENIEQEEADDFLEGGLY